MTRLDNIHPYRVRNMYTEVDIVTADMSVTEGTKFIEPTPFKKNLGICHSLHWKFWEMIST